MGIHLAGHDFPKPAASPVGLTDMSDCILACFFNLIKANPTADFPGAPGAVFCKA